MPRVIRCADAQKASLAETCAALDAREFDPATKTA